MPSLRERDEGDHQGDEVQEQQRLARDQRRVAEHQHEREQVERQRDHPQQRRGGHVGGDMHREGRHQADGHERQPDPAQALGPVGHHGGSVRRRGRRLGHAATHLCSAHQEERGREREHQQAVGIGPQVAQRGQAERRLQEERIAQQRDQAAEVAGGVEEIGIARIGMAGAGEPGLQQRRVGGDGHERQADRHREHGELPQIGLARRRVAAAGRHADGQADHGQQRTRRDG